MILREAAIHIAEGEFIKDITGRAVYPSRTAPSSHVYPGLQNPQLFEQPERRVAIR